MKKLLLFSILGLLVFTPFRTFAAFLTDSPTYAAPATVNYTGANGTGGVCLYRDGETYPIACNESMAIPVDGTFNTLTYTTGAFTGYVGDSYHALQANTLGCSPGNSPPNGLTWADCVSNNPGADQTDWTITGDYSPAYTPGFMAAAATINPPEQVFDNLGLDIIYAAVTLILVGAIVYALK